MRGEFLFFIISIIINYSHCPCPMKYMSMDCNRNELPPGRAMLFITLIVLMLTTQMHVWRGAWRRMTSSSSQWQYWDVFTAIFSLWSGKPGYLIDYITLTTMCVALGGQNKQTVTNFPPAGTAASTSPTDTILSEFHIDSVQSRVTCKRFAT